MKEKLQKLWHDQRVSCVLFILFLISWILQFIFQIQEVKGDAIDAKKHFAWGDVWLRFWSTTMQNWQAEFMQLLIFILLTAYIIRQSGQKHSPSDLENKVNQILALLSKDQNKHDPH